MATMLETYTSYKAGFESRMRAAMPGPAEVWRQQELLYRIEVLEACQTFVKTAPKSVEPGSLYWHYQMVDAYFHSLTTERRFGKCSDENRQKQRDTAHGNLLKVVQDYRSRFSSFAPGNDTDYYQKTISSIIQTILPVWIQYRQTFIEITKEAS
jgi:hypothetical protein